MEDFKVKKVVITERSAKIPHHAIRAFCVGYKLLISIQLNNSFGSLLGTLNLFISSSSFMILSFVTGFCVCLTSLFWIRLIRNTTSLSRYSRGFSQLSFSRLSTFSIIWTRTWPRSKPLGRGFSACFDFSFMLLMNFLFLFNTKDYTILLDNIKRKIKKKNLISPSFPYSKRLFINWETFFSSSKLKGWTI